MSDQKKFLKSCPYQLNGHYKKTIKQTLEQISNRVDPSWLPDHYGTGESVNQFEKKLSAFLGKEDCLFFPSGTMAQQIALRCWADQSKNLSLIHI